MPKPTLILVNGAPGTGKTTLSKKLTQELSLPLFNRDDIKVTLFETCGWQDRKLNVDLIHASFELFHQQIEIQLKAGKSLIAETAFTSKWDVPRFQNLKSKYQFNIFQIYCHAAFDVVFERYKKRNESGTLHPGFIDHSVTYDKYKSSVKDGKYRALEIDGSFFELDMTDFDAIDYESLYTTLHSALN